MATAAPLGATPTTKVARRASRGIWRDALSRLLRNRPALVGLFIIGAFVFIAILAPVLAPYDPLGGALKDNFKPPSAQHLMGTDRQGRDDV